MKFIKYIVVFCLIFTFSGCSGLNQSAIHSGQDDRNIAVNASAIRTPTPTRSATSTSTPRPGTPTPTTSPSPTARAGTPAPTGSSQVPQLPADNLIKNPWFRDANDQESLAFWTDETPKYDPPYGFWNLSTKDSNPTYNGATGTCARLSVGEQGGTINKTIDPGHDAYLTQEVTANAGNKKLKFFMHWVAHTIKPADVKIYGSNSPGGPWTFLWEPLNQTILKSVKPPAGQGVSWLWTYHTGLTFPGYTPLEKTIVQGYSNYRIVVHANLPDLEGGFKFTGVYFTAVAN